jgi:hypothetical protein
MPKDWQGIEEEPHVQPSSAAGGGKAKKNTDAGFEGYSEKNLAPADAEKAARKGEKK